MTTITVNEKTKAGKSFLEFAKNLPFVKLEQSEGLGKPTIEKKLSKQQQILLIAKKTKNAGTRKAFKKLGLDYDSYSR